MTRRPVPFSGRRPALLALLAGTVLLSPAAHAARMTLSGEDLDLSIPCTGQVRVVVDPGMKDGATLDSSSLAQVSMHTGKEEAQSRISIATKSCAPNGKLTISISPSTGLTIHDSHDTHFIITGKLASLDASLNSTTMDIENTQSLDLDMQGASTVHIKSLERAAQIVASGTSTLTADTAQLAALSAQLTQNAGMTLSGGTIDALTLITADQASATILGQATVATVAANGTGDVNIESVSGPMVRSGKGTVRVGAQNGVIYRQTPPPPVAPPAAATPAPLPATPVQPPVTDVTPTTPVTTAPPPVPAPVAPAAPINPSVPQPHDVPAPSAPSQPDAPSNHSTDRQQPAALPAAPVSPGTSGPSVTQEANTTPENTASAPARSAGQPTSQTTIQNQAQTEQQAAVQPASRPNASVPKTEQTTTADSGTPHTASPSANTATSNSAPTTSDSSKGE
ncbi:hypothetical protein [Gluconobacter kanchanaburiensis]|uniref:Auto-transporter adhesin head GIN domain-containing protein n=1 Tax=Gluconobacter kanchanaburiensis NBRC 103587 TaxID=1307948 RepID=A0A511B5D8_9PROT|nr:hypothetical protein [Gluconobacter kanchanaburiensis]GBR67987.1 hypothetical protein AA103587_0571 [Gluconobacter kanchanaburiensis NBRC 103587]GEK95649.1 hypothetical protein GKA01_08460 [Gluconobacter kanchanaburiensis NBRC 103587]